jgi:putative SOS response-associated peptidase YedK
MQLAGLSETIEDPESGDEVTTFSIVTVSANELMSKIHNKPKAREARMPLILNTEEAEDIWLKPEEEHLLEKVLETVAHGLEDGLLDFHTVGRLRGKEYRGNVRDISEPVHYPELQLSGLPL